MILPICASIPCDLKELLKWSNIPSQSLPYNFVFLTNQVLLRITFLFGIFFKDYHMVIMGSLQLGNLEDYNHFSRQPSY